jgi:hypothetical protein
MPSFVELDGGYPNRTYSCAQSLTLSNSGLTDVVALIGNNTSLVLLKEISLAFSATTPTQIGITIFKRTTLSTATVTIPMPICQHNSGDIAPDAIVDFYETIATVGTGVAFESFYLEPPPGNGSQEYEYGPWKTVESITLYYSNESVCINLEGNILAGEILRFKFRWTEIPG